MWKRRLIDGLHARNPSACDTAAALLLFLPDDVATIAAALPVHVDGVTVRNMGGHLIVRDDTRSVMITCPGLWLVWAHGVVIHEAHGLDAAVRFAARWLTAQ